MRAARPRVPGRRRRPRRARASGERGVAAHRGGRVSRRSLDRPSLDRSGSRPLVLPCRSSSRTCSRASIASSFIAAVDVVVGELSLREERRQPCDRVGAEREIAENAREILVRGLRRSPRDAVRREHALHSRVRGDDRASRVSLGAEVVERLVEHGGELFGELLARARLARATRRSATTYAITAASTRPTTPRSGSTRCSARRRRSAPDRAVVGTIGPPPNGGSSSTLLRLGTRPGGASTRTR